MHIYYDACQYKNTPFSTVFFRRYDPRYEPKKHARIYSKEYLSKGLFYVFDLIIGFYLNDTFLKKKIMRN